MPVKLPEMPAHIAHLKCDERGYPVPWFVAWINGKPDFRVVNPGKIIAAYRKNLCWICGGVMGVHRVFAIGPMCVINRVSSEPPSHRDCAEFAAKACPFLTHPHRKRDDRDLPDNISVAGVMIERNPGVICLYETRKHQPFNAGNGVLFKLGDPDKVEFWAEGREATRAEVWASIESGYPILYDMARREGAEAVKKLEADKANALRHLPSQNKRQVVAS